MVEYFTELWKSIKVPFYKPVLFLPFLLQAIANVLLLLIVVALGALVVFMAKEIVTPALIVAAVPIVLVVIVFFIFMNAWFTAGVLGMVNDVTDGRKTGSATFFSTANSKVGTYFMFAIEQAILFLVPLAVVAIPVILAFVFEGGARVGAIILAVMLFFLFLAYGILLSVALFFAVPIIIRKDIRAWAAITESTRLVWQRAGHVWLSWLIYVGFSLVVGFGIGMFFSILSFPLDLWVQATNSFIPISINLVLSIVRAVIQIAMTIIGLAFLFKMYKYIDVKAAPKKAGQPQ